MAFGNNGHGFAALAAAIAVMAVAGCDTPAPAPPAPVAVVAPAERPAATRPAAPPKPVDLHWAFTATASTCTARASGPGGSLQIQADGSQPLTITARFTTPSHAIPPRARPAKLTFRGEAGTWTLAGTWQTGAFTSKQRLDEHGVATILGLLGGGIAVISAGPIQLGTARLPAANAAGNAWVQCPKTLMNGP
jgi:hypothetical protein